MIKKIRQEDKEEKQNPGRNRDNKYESQVQFMFLFDEMTVTGFHEITKTAIAPYSIGHVIDRSIAIFHPPQHNYKG